MSFPPIKVPPIRPIVPPLESFQDRLRKALEKKIPDAHCPLCGVHDWGVYPDVQLFWSQMSSPLVLSVACGVMSCNNCGNTHFIDLSAYGDEFKGDINP